MHESKLVITILGSAGGLARSLLTLLNKASTNQHDPIHQKIYHSTIDLIDNKQRPLDYYKSICPDLLQQLRIHQVDLMDTIILRNFLKRSHTSIVIDVSLADTIEMLDCCNQLGVNYINSALENIYLDDHPFDNKGFPLIERLRFFEKYKDDYCNLKAIVCSGMNPGVVQWMAVELMNKHPNEQPLACFIVENDTSFFKNKTAGKTNVIYTTWSPECFLKLATQSYPMYMKHKTPLFLYEHTFDLEFKVTLGDKKFHGCLMPHEDCYTLCRLFDLEGGYFYKVNDHTTNLIRNNLNHPDKIWKLDRKVLDPLESPLGGEDLVGVLLVYPDKERYMYNVVANDFAYEQLKTNATYFQAACGLYAAFAVLLNDAIENGVYYVDDLLVKTDNHYGEYLSYYMTDFVCGENPQTDGLLLDRMKNLGSS
ncbi:S-adenosylmethionine decarboxylase related protein [Bacillus sp. AFS076308]|uniref:S-adenosylmethionine decarboxylase related protein n=1 Tax=unclassified Bacillus (in: firmicutes) TaxID=185979 RepID=UPI000BF6B340|nr:MULTISPECIES: S-adenosylmethionine decarboxylase related protein [unclassified Bacillus (in: firmicutes)]PFN74820.1 S-adenosylmethionine decarboxylase related protein [Bacillus sp. AFS076308]PGV46608.1 S-adenosylmethionine decarboxylase related protein [Bacillus sp. AFS037270]